MTDVTPPRIYVDTSVFVESFDGTEPKARHVLDLLSAFRERPKQAVTSEFTLAEVFGKESPRSWALQTRFFLNLIVRGRSIDLMPVSRSVLLDTGDLRRATRKSGRKTGLPDAIHMVTAIQAQCQYILTSDKRMVVPNPLAELDPRELTRAHVEQLLDA